MKLMCACEPRVETPVAWLFDDVLREYRGTEVEIFCLCFVRHIFWRESGLFENEPKRHPRRAAAGTHTTQRQ